MEKEIATAIDRKTDVSKFVQIVERYTDIRELTYEIVHEFIDKILVHEFDPVTDTRMVEIHYNFVGRVDAVVNPASATTYVRRERKNIVSIAM